MFNRDGAHPPIQSSSPGVTGSAGEATSFQLHSHPSVSKAGQTLEAAPGRPQPHRGFELQRPKPAMMVSLTVLMFYFLPQ